jgi:hypothetical protein
VHRPLPETVAPCPGQFNMETPAAGTGPMIGMDLTAGLERQRRGAHVTGGSPAGFGAGALEDQAKEIILMSMAGRPKASAVGTLGQNKPAHIAILDGSAVKRTGRQAYQLGIFGICRHGSSWASSHQNLSLA